MPAITVPRHSDIRVVWLPFLLIFNNNNNNSKEQHKQQQQNHQDGAGAHLAPVAARVFCLRILNHKSPTPRTLTWSEEDDADCYHFYANKKRLKQYYADVYDQTPKECNVGGDVGIACFADIAEI